MRSSSQYGRFLASVPSSLRRSRSPSLKIPLSARSASNTTSALTRERSMVSIASAMLALSDTLITP